MCFKKEGVRLLLLDVIESLRMVIRIMKLLEGFWEI